MRAELRAKAILLSIGIVMLFLATFLSYQNGQLRTALETNMKKVAYPYVGMQVPAVPAAMSDGSTVTLGSPTDGHQLLFFFNTKCPYCLESMPAINRIKENLAASHPGIDVIGVSKDNMATTAEYLQANSSALLFTSLDDYRSISLFHASGVPTLMLIGSDGIVLVEHTGVLNAKEDVDAILSAVEITDVANPGT